PEGGLSARYRFNKRHSLNVNGMFSSRTFNSSAYDCAGADLGRRSDKFFVVGAAYWYRGPVIFSLGYGYTDSDSSACGWDIRQHRVTLTFGAPLFWQLMVMVDVNLRFNQYPDGIYIDPIILTLDESGENLSSGVLKLVRPIGEHFEIEARYGF